MSDQTPEDKNTLRKQTAEEDDLFSAVQEGFGTLPAGAAQGNKDHLDTHEHDFS